jgi:2-oxoisovalerate dehydrogenase E2 component (dihydrolipoyl transacylase)
VDIPSRFSGVIKKLHYEAGEMAKVGKPLIDIDVPEEVAEEVEEAGADPLNSDVSEGSESVQQEGLASTIPPSTSTGPSETTPVVSNGTKPKSKHATLSTPAVRHISKELNVDISEIDGTGKDGRVTKDDVYQFAKRRDSGESQTGSPPPTTTTQSLPSRPKAEFGPQQETSVPLSKIQGQMFKSMTASLKIPHFLYSDELDVSALFHLRSRLNKSLARSPAADGQVMKLSILPFLVKAMSLMLDKYPILNARVDAGEAGKPSLVMRSQHNIGIAMDTPTGLIVPVIKNVGSLNVLEIAAELKRLQAAATAGKLTTSDLTGGTITLSNIGNIGGTVVSPVIVEKEVAILGIGKKRTIPAFGEDGEIVKKEVMSFSWSADHRVVDGATMARAAEVVRGFVEEPDLMLVHLH